MAAADISRQRKYRVIFLLGWFANLALCSLVCFVLIRSLIAIADPDHWVLVSFWIHIVLFVNFSFAFLLFLLRSSHTAVIFAIIFTVCQFLCVLITALTLIADDEMNTSVGFKKDPILWIKSRHWIPILFAILFLPLFAVQIFLINRYAGHLLVNGGKNTYVSGNTAKGEERGGMVQREHQ